MANESFDLDISIRTRETGGQQAGASVTRVLREVQATANDASRATTGLASAYKTVDQAAGQTARASDQLAAAIKRVEMKQAAREADELAGAHKRVEEASRQARAEQERQQQALKQSQAGFGALKNVVGAFGVTLSAQFAIGAIVDFGKEVIALGGKLTDLSARMGVGVEAAQEIKFALDQTGSSAEGGARAISAMNDRLTEGKKGTVAALKDLNLQIENLRAMKPEDAFMAIAAAIKDVPDPMRQTQLAMELFGKAGVELLPAIKQGMGELREEARRLGQVLSKEDVAALDEFGDRWDAQMNRMKVGAATTALAVADAFKESWATILRAQIAFLGDSNAIAMGLARTAARARAGPVERLPSVGDALMEGGIDGPAGAVGRRAPALAADAKAAEDWAKRVRAAYEHASGVEAQRNVTLLREAYALLSEDQKKNGDIVRRLLEPYDALRRQVKALPIELERARAEFMPLPSRNLFTDIATGQLRIAGAMPVVANAASQLQHQMAGLTKDGLLPVSKSFAQVVEVVDTTGLRTRNITGMIEESRSKTVEWSTSLDGLARSFADLAQIGGSSFGGIAKQIAEVIGLMQVGSQVGQQFRNAFYNPAKSQKWVVDPATGQRKLQNVGGFDFSALGGGQGTGATIAAYSNLATTAVGAYGTMMQATDVAGRGNRAARGALAGAQIGGSIVPGYGHLIGAAAGAIWGAVRNPAWEDIQKRVQNELKVVLPEELARSIADQAKAMFHGDRGTAEMFNFAAIIQAAGGVNDSNIDRFSSKFRDVFSSLERGKLSTQQAAKVIDESWDTMAQAAMKKGGLLTAKMQEMIALNQRFGTGSAAIASFVQQQIGSSLGGITTFLDIGNAARKASGDTTNADKIAANEAEMVALRGKEGGAGVGDEERITQLAAENVALAKADEQRKQAGKVAGIASINTEGAAGATAAAIAGSFAKLQQEGMSLPDALRAVEPAAKALQEQLQAAGLSGGAAFEDLQKKIALANDSVAGPGIAAMQAYAGSIAGLYNSGVLTTEMFAGMASQVAASRDALIAQGVDGTAAMEMMKPQLQQMWEISQRMPGVIDESTKKMLEEAEAAGIVGAKWRTANDRIATATERMAEILETVFADRLPSAIQTAADAAAAGVERTGRAIDDVVAKIPRRIPIEVEYTQKQYGDPAEDPSGAPDVPGAADGVYANGARGGLTWFGEGGQPELGGPRSFMAGVLADAMRMNGGGVGGSIVIHPSPVIIGGKKIGQITYEQTAREARRRGVLR